MYNKPPNHHKLLTNIRTGKFAKSKLFTTFASRLEKHVFHYSKNTFIQQHIKYYSYS